YDRSVENQAPIRSEGGRSVELRVGQNLSLTCGQIHEREAVASLYALNESKRFAFRAVARRHVVAALESHALDIGSCRAHAVDLRRAAAIRSEQDVLAVGREARLGVDGAAVGQARGIAAIGVDQVDLRYAVLRQRDCQLLA